ncbi:hypothetical protein Vi05172_g11071 [Venturia inaequalis]|nr:hypothetical protein Vi05172_g11071 [Venturia inaequalis]
MRLLNVRTMKMEEFFAYIPRYAILSHTWAHEELTFQEMISSSPEIKRKEGYKKILECSKICQERNMTYVWIDTISIDKSSSAELSEAINTMWRWYREAAVCYVYLEDFHAPLRIYQEAARKEDFQRLLPQEVQELASLGLELDSTEEEELLPEPIDEASLPLEASSQVDIWDSRSARLSLTYQRRRLLRRCKWFTRGWTLQELIAPHTMIFFTAEWEEFGSKARLISDLSKITHISELVLQTGRLEAISIAQRMSWAANRETTRTEDMAYCLLGILDVNMPLLYGEGNKAFQRLQEEVIKASSDLSIFAWQDKLHDSRLSHQDVYRGLLARHPRDFASRISIRPSQGSAVSMPYMVTNHGLSLKLRLLKEDGQEQVYFADLECQKAQAKMELFKMGHDNVGICLKRLSPDGDQFVRIRANRSVKFPSQEYIAWNNLVVQREQIFVRQSIIIPDNNFTTALSAFLLEIESSNLEPSFHPMPKSCAKRFAECGIQPHILSSSVEFVGPSTVNIVTTSAEPAKAALRMMVPVDLSIACFILLLGYTDRQGAWWELLPASNRFVDDRTTARQVMMINEGSADPEYRKRLSSDLEVIINTTNEVHEDRLAIRVRITPKIRPRAVSCRIDIVI